MTTISGTTFSNAFSWIKKFLIGIQILLKFVPKGPIDNKWALVQVMDWRQAGHKPFPEQMVIQIIDPYMWHLGEMS